MLHTEAVKPECLAIVKQLMEVPFFSEFRLVGGTALGLQLGHRISEDVDLFTDHPFDTEVAKAKLIEAFGFDHVSDFSSNAIGLKCRINDVRADLVNWNVPFIHAPLVEDNIRMAHPDDLFAMKLDAVTGRAAKKDYYDLAELVQKFSLEHGLLCYKRRFPLNDLQTVLRNYMHFEQAEESADPLSLRNLSWSDVRVIIKNSFDRYSESIQLKKQREVAERERKIRELIEKKKKRKK